MPAPRFKALLLENIHPSAHEILTAEGCELEIAKTALSEAELKTKLRSVDILGIRSKTQV